MTGILAGLGAVVAAYLIGGIPFGFLVAKLFRNVDIRTVGSGNIGATNVGRVLGFRFFLLVFALDLLKGLLPTLFLPRGLASLALPVRPDLAVFIGLAAILGHNFSIYLRFKGGKGVATSLGVLFAWDVVAAISAGVGFLVFLSLTGFVSLSSILGGACFVAIHFMQIREPFSRGQTAMSVVTLGLMGLVIVRHRANLGRIASGTEPKLKLRKPRRSGRAAIWIVLCVVVASIAVGIALGLNAARKTSVTAGPIRIEEVSRLATGHQRAERVLFLNRGKSLAVTCPRYGRVVLATISDANKFEPVLDIPLDGRPVALASASDRFYVLQRPNGDARHLEEAWWDVFDFKGKSVEPRVRAGWDPDDLALHPNGKHALILTSGSAEGERNRPDPALLVFDLTATPPREIARVAFGERNDDPARLALSADGKRAAVTLGGSNSLAWINLDSVQRPRLDRREALPGSITPEAIYFDGRGRLWVADPEGNFIGRQEVAGGPTRMSKKLGGSADFAVLPIGPGILAASLPKNSGVGFYDIETIDKLGQLSIRGMANLAETRPLGMALSPERGLLAVANRAGGSVHLFHFEATEPPTAAQSHLADASGVKGK